MSRPSYMSMFPVALLLLAAGNQLASAESVKGFLLVGASNMSGEGSAEDVEAPWNIPQDDVWIWQDDLGDNVGWTSLRPGFGNTDNNFGSGGNHLREGSPPIDRFGPELSLGRTLADAFPGDRIALLKHAVGGTGLESDWNPENLGPPGKDHCWNGLMAKSDTALSMLTDGGHDFEMAGLFIFTAKDSANKTGVEVDNYAKNLPSFLASVREHYSEPELAFVLAPVPSFFDVERFPGRDVINSVQASVAASDPLVGLIDVDDLQTGGGIHFDAIGQIGLGERYANAYIELKPIPEPSSLIMVISALLGVLGLCRHARTWTA